MTTPIRMSAIILCSWNLSARNFETFVYLCGENCPRTILVQWLCSLYTEKVPSLHLRYNAKKNKISLRKRSLLGTL